MAPKHESSDAGHWDVPKRSHQAPPSGEKLNALHKERKKLYAEVAKIYGKNQSSIREIVRKEKKFVVVLLSNLKLQMLMPQCVTRA